MEENEKRGQQKKKRKENKGKRRRILCEIRAEQYRNETKTERLSRHISVDIQSTNSLSADIDDLYSFVRLTLNECWLFDVVNRYVLYQSRNGGEKRKQKRRKDQEAFLFLSYTLSFSSFFRRTREAYNIVSSHGACIFLLQISLVVPFRKRKEKGKSRTFELVPSVSLSLLFRSCFFRFTRRFDVPKKGSRGQTVQTRARFFSAVERKNCYGRCKSNGSFSRGNRTIEYFLFDGMSTFNKG